MTEKIDVGLFARLMQTPASARKDLLEYIGQGPVALSADLPFGALPDDAPGGDAQAGGDMPRPAPATDSGD